MATGDVALGLPQLVGAYLVVGGTCVNSTGARLSPCAPPAQPAQGGISWAVGGRPVGRMRQMRTVPGPGDGPPSPFAFHLAFGSWASRTVKRARPAPPKGEARRRPCWDRPRGELRLGGVVVKRLPAAATAQIAVLEAFQAAGWAAEIDAVLEGGEDPPAEAARGGAEPQPLPAGTRPDLLAAPRAAGLVGLTGELSDRLRRLPDCPPPPSC
jgi:hypothetical protein